MRELMLGLLFIVAVIICYAYPCAFNRHYMDKYGEKGISYSIAILSGASALFVSLVYENKGTIQYSFAMILVVISLILNLYKFLRNSRKEYVELGDKIKLVICQILFSIGMFGLLVAMLGTLYLAGGGNKRNKRK